MPLTPDAIHVLQELNPWWRAGLASLPQPQPYRRPLVQELAERLKKPKGLIEVVRGPRQVGKSTGIHQIAHDLMRTRVPPTDILFVRFDLEVLREASVTLRSILAWYVETIRGRPLSQGSSSYLLLDEVHKFRRWHEEVKHIGDTHPVRMLLTGSSSVLVARGGRESLAGRIFTTELPTFSFREVLECWKPALAHPLPGRLRFEQVFDSGILREQDAALSRLRPQQHLTIARALERYYMRGGYPRLHGGEVEDDRWADYLVQTVFESVLGTDIPDLFPVENPRLLRQLYFQIARLTATEIPQNKLASLLTESGYGTNQPTVGRYLRYLTDALLVREFRRYPLGRKTTSRTPSKITVSDLGIRNAIFRGAPSLSESDPSMLGPLVETLAQGVMRGPNLQLHFYRDYQIHGDRKSPACEVDFVVERIDGTVVPLEVKFRKRIDPGDVNGVRLFMERFGSPLGLVVTRNLTRWDEQARILYTPLQNFLLMF